MVSNIRENWDLTLVFGKAFLQNLFLNLKKMISRTHLDHMNIVNKKNNDKTTKSRS